MHIGLCAKGAEFSADIAQAGGERAPHGVQRPADHPGAVGAVVRFERAAGEITFVRSYFN